MSQQSLPLFVGEEAENQNTEFKLGSQGRLPDELWQTISAFANTSGGTIVLGVDSKGVTANLSRDEIDKLQQDVTSLCKSSFNHEVSLEVANRDGVLIVNIRPSPSQLRPIFSSKRGRDKGTFIRVGSGDYRATEEDLNRFSVAARGGAETLEYEDYKYQDYLDDSDLDRYIELTSQKRGNVYQDLSHQEILFKLRAIDKQGDVTLFGLLAFGKNEALQEIVAPTVNIAATQYPGMNKVNEDDLSETYLDNREFNGNALKQFESAFGYIKSRLPIRGTVDANGIRRDYLVIPEIAIREALANAIAHRDYSTYQSRIQVDIYSDRLEIINPGSSLVPIDQLESAPSSSRNPLLMSYLKEHGITEQKARGIRTIRLSLKKAGLLEPRFENVDQSFRVTLYASAFISNSDKTWLAKFAQYNLNERQQNALAHVRNSPDGISNGEYRDINSMNNVRDDKKANKELMKLVRLRILISTGENRARRYVLNPSFLQ